MNNFCVIENGQVSGSFQDYLQVTGSYNYFVCVDIQRKPGTTNSSISITTFSRADRSIAIGSKCKWFLRTSDSKYDLHMTANFYQVSPRDASRMVEVVVKPYEDGFDGQCVVKYGPIKLDTYVQSRYSEAIKMNYLEMDCQGTSKRSSFKFDLMRVDNEEVQCYDRAYNKLVDTIRISKDVITDASQVESLAMRVVAPGNGRHLFTLEVNVKLRNHDDRDVLILFLQSMINNKAGGRSTVNQQNDVSMFGKPQRIPQQLDESMLYDPKAIQFTAPGLNRINSGDNFSMSQIQPYPEELMEAKPMHAKAVYPMQEPQMRDSYVRQISLGQDNYSPRGSAGSYRPSYTIPDDQIRRTVVERQTVDARYEGNGVGARTSAGGIEAQPRAGGQDELMTENARLKAQNRALMAENDLLSKQKTELMVDQSMINTQSDQAYRKQIDNLTLKVKEYRTKSKELEGLLLDAETRRMDTMRALEEKTSECVRAYIYFDTGRLKPYP